MRNKQIRVWRLTSLDAHFEPVSLETNYADTSLADALVSLVRGWRWGNAARDEATTLELKHWPLALSAVEANRVERRL